MGRPAIAFVDHRRQFSDAMISEGLGLPDIPLDDGVIHRFRVEGDKSGKKNGWYCLYGDGVPAGSYGSWKTGEVFTWCAKSKREMSSAERIAHQERVAAAKEQRKIEQAKVHSEAAMACSKLWEAANPTVSTSNAYLVDKQIPSINVRQLRESLVVPVRNTNGELTSLQFISPEGSKRFKSGGQIQGCYSTVGQPTDTVYIAEGYATAVTIHQATDCIVVVAFNAGNLLAATQAIQSKYPDKALIVCADNDTKTEGNPGIEKAKQAAKECGVSWTYPDFGGDEGDFNDLQQQHGLDVVAKQLAANLQSSSEFSDIVEPDDDDAKIGQLASLSVLDYDRARAEAAKALRVRPGMLDKVVLARRKELEGEPEGAQDELSKGIEPWDSAVDGQQLAGEMNALLRRYCILPEGGYEAVTLWAIGSYVYNSFRIFPKLCLSSPEKRCGKTTLLETIAAITNRALIASNMSPATIFRSIECWTPALLIDEGDTFLHGNEELRGIINSGHTRSTAFVLRVEEINGVREPKKFSTWAPMAIAMIKTPPDTILDRSVLIPLRRKMPTESVTRLPLDLQNECRDIRRKTQRWADDHMEALAAFEPDVPAMNNDRAEDNWRPLITIADVLGGEWPVLVRNAVTKLESGKVDDEGVGEMLLTDVQAVFSDIGIGKISSQDLVDRLIDTEDRPWSEWKRGQPMTKVSLSRLLSPYGIKSKTVRFQYTTKKGYEKGQFSDAFARYLSDPPVSNVTTSHPSNDAASSVTFANLEGVSENQNVTLQPSNGAGCDVVTFQTGEGDTISSKSEELDLLALSN